MNYLIDAYTIFAASVLAANAVLRSIFGAVFPLFTTQMYNGLGIHWASSIPAFLALVCVPMPFLFYKYGPKVREKCKYAGEAAAFMKKMQAQMEDTSDDGEGEEKGDGEGVSDADTAVASPSEEKEKEHEERERQEEREEQEAFDYSYEDENQPEGSRFQRIKTNQSRPAGAKRRASYEANPFDLDHVNTRESFKRERKSSEVGRLSRASSRTSRR